MTIHEWQMRYDRWWVGKMCRLAGSDHPYKKVVRVELVGSPSFVYGCAYLHFEDRTTTPVYDGGAFRPRKSDVEVLGEPRIICEVIRLEYCSERKEHYRLKCGHRAARVRQRGMPAPESMYCGSCTRKQREVNRILFKSKKSPGE